ncbi:glycoside hydrolase family 64 protein [Xylaria nigripes]|nr:glycoside hydrolase family 64 protein [Xylaria nigripes]
MRGFFGIVAAALVGLVMQSTAGPTVARPGDADDIVFTKENTINSTVISPPMQNISQAGLPISVTNNFGSGMFMYVTGTDSSGKPCLLGANGQYIYPQADGTGVPKEIVANIALPLGAQGQTTTVKLPGPLISARIWFAQGQLKFFTVKDGNGASAIVEPSGVNPSDPSSAILWGFIEFNFDGTTIFANISYVDFVGLSLGMSLTLASGQSQTVKGLVEGAVAKICEEVKKQAGADGQPWDELCVTSSSGEALRVLSPNLFVSANPSKFSSYYDDYVNQVWNQYSGQDLTINTQVDAGNVACRVNNNQFTCAGDNRSYPKPTTLDIWGCNTGPFAIAGGDNGIHRAVVPRLCAAFTRSTLLVDGGNVQPSLGPDNYYNVNPTNHYSRIVHMYETDNIGYAFSYDDVNPDGQNAGGVVSGNNPTNLKVTVGNWS